jgi:transposase
MAAETEDFASWLAQAEIPESRLTPQVEAVLQAVHHFRHEQGSDYYSTRLLGHFLLHCHSGLKVAQIARLVGISRPTASEQQGLSSKQVIQQTHHRLKGRPYGKLLPRFAGPIAGFLHSHPDASRADLLAFIDSTFGVKVSRIAVYKFLKKYGLDHQAQPQTPVPPPGSALPPDPPQPTGPAGFKPALALPPQLPPAPGPVLPLPAVPAEHTPRILLPGPELIPLLAPPPAPPFSSGGPSSPAPSC